MGEIRLICPGCKTEYQIPESALPATGREVECSSCGQSWRATPPKLEDSPPLELGSYLYNFDALPRADQVEPPHPPLPEPAAAAPEAIASPPELIGPPPPVADDIDIEPIPRRRQLPDSVLSILLEEVEHERQAREAEATRAVPDNQDSAMAEADWPATTVTIGSKKPEPVIEAAPEAVADLPKLVQTQPETSGYWKGMGTAGAIAASLVAIYALAPAMADAGVLGDLLMGMRQGMDSLRHLLRGA